ncbi:MAG: DUF192 domain-containing protein [Verrucomicrobia bacterium]|nr:DUF192 domain-containing protein [Verrucomicrobiota bacterium]
MSLALVLYAGCSESEHASSAPPTATTKGPEQAQPTLPTIKLWLGAEEIAAEQALTETQIQTGLMFRKEMPENHGMLFVFSEPHRASFWMRNTILPLTCAYIGPDGVVLEIRDMKPLDETPIEAASAKVQFVLEMNQGWFARHHISTGTVVRTERGSLLETYFTRR